MRLADLSLLCVPGRHSVGERPGSTLWHRPPVTQHLWPNWEMFWRQLCIRHCFPFLMGHLTSFSTSRGAAQFPGSSVPSRGSLGCFSPVSSEPCVGNPMQPGTAAPQGQHVAAHLALQPVWGAPEPLPERPRCWAETLGGVWEWDPPAKG